MHKQRNALCTFIFLGGSCTVMARSNSARVLAASPALISCTPQGTRTNEAPFPKNGYAL